MCYIYFAQNYNAKVCKVGRKTQGVAADNLFGEYRKFSNAAPPCEISLPLKIRNKMRGALIYGRVVLVPLQAKSPNLYACKNL